MAPTGQRVRNNGRGEADAGGDFQNSGRDQGLRHGQHVITHPSDAIADGVAITEREAQ